MATSSALVHIPIAVRLGFGNSGMRVSNSLGGGGNFPPLVTQPAQRRTTALNVGGASVPCARLHGDRSTHCLPTHSVTKEPKFFGYLAQMHSGHFWPGMVVIHPPLGSPNATHSLSHTAALRAVAKARQPKAVRKRVVLGAGRRGGAGEDRPRRAIQWLGRGRPRVGLGRRFIRWGAGTQAPPASPWASTVRSVHRSSSASLFSANRLPRWGRPSPPRKASASLAP